jgi:Ca2+/Na+ antiporter
MNEEEEEIHPMLVPRRVHSDPWVAGGALVLVVAASVVMERAAQSVGRHFSISGIVIGGIVLAAVTSLPNAVAAVYLAKKGRGTAMLSTALNSNALNVAVGFLIPGAVLGLGAAASPEIVVVLWYLGLTAIVLLFAYRDRGLRRSRGVVILVAYGCFVATLLADVHG